MLKAQHVVVATNFATEPSSAAFKEICGEKLVHLGTHRLADIPEVTDAYTLSEFAEGAGGTRPSPLG